MPLRQSIEQQECFPTLLLRTRKLPFNTHAHTHAHVTGPFSSRVAGKVQRSTVGAIVNEFGQPLHRLPGEGEPTP